MNTVLLEGSPDWFVGLLRLSLQAALLAALVLMTLAIFGRWIPANWRALLWFLVIVRAVLPFSLPSSFSMEHLLGRLPKQTTVTPLFRVLAASEFASGPVAAREQSAPVTPTLGLRPGEAFAAIWAFGAAVSLVILAGRALMMRRRLALEFTDAMDELTHEFNACVRLLGVRYPVRLYRSNRMAGPALTGLLPARLIVPNSLVNGDFTNVQVRQIFLHELAHVKQGHLWMHWVALIAKAALWLNPVIHFAAARMRAECEMAADAAVLKKASGNEREAYGETILKVVERAIGPSPALVLGMAAQARELERRLRALHRPSRAWRHVIGVGAVCMIGLVGLSRAEAETNAAPSTFGAPVASEPESGTVRLGIHVFDFRDGIVSAFVADPSNVTNILFSGDSAKALIREARGSGGTDLISLGTYDFKIGIGSEIQIGEDARLGTNCPMTLSLRPLGMNGDALSLDTQLVLNTFLGASAETNSPPAFRVRQVLSTNSIPERGALGIFVPSHRNRIPILSDFPFLGRLFRSETDAKDVKGTMVLLSRLDAEGPDQNTAKFLTRRFKVDVDAVVKMTPERSAPLDTLRELFLKAGINFGNNVASTGGVVPPGFGGPNERSFFYNYRNGILLIRATTNDFQKIEKVLAPLQGDRK